MKVWYLATEGCDHAVVFAETKDEAKEKAEARTKISKEDWSFGYEFKPGMHGDVLWFC